MLAVYRRTIRDKYRSFLTYTFSILLFLTLYVGLYPSVRAQSKQLDQLIKIYPASFFKALGINPAELTFAHLEAYIGSEQFSFVWPILAVIFAASMAAYICVNDIDRGTIEVVVALPLSRAKLFFERYFAGFTLLVAFAFASVYGIIPLAKFYGVPFELANYLPTFVGASLFLWGVYSVATFFSVLFSEKSAASLATGGMILLMYVLNIVSNLQDKLKNFQYFSFFHYFNGVQLISKGVYTDNSIVFFSVISLVLLFISFAIFMRRDLSV